MLPEKLQQKLQDRQNSNTYRELKITRFLVDFCSNDYLGLARLEALRKAVAEESAALGNLQAGATRSRLLSGNYAETEALETMLATFHHSEASLLFNSGYVANTGFF